MEDQIPTSFASIKLSYHLLPIGKKKKKERRRKTGKEKEKVQDTTKMTGPVHNSAVYILGQPQHAPAIPPPSPPSPAAAADDRCAPIEHLSLADDVVTTASPPESPSSTSSFSNDDDDNNNSNNKVLNNRLASAVHVLHTEAASLAALADFYTTDAAARTAFDAAVEAITTRSACNGKLIIIGVGKSGHIARKLVATFNSLAVCASFLHPTEALHGDLGHVGPNDTLLLLTFSGKTPELSLLLPHLDPRLPLVVLTGRTGAAEVVNQRRNQQQQCNSCAPTILLPAPIHESEVASFGVSAPTTSTTMAIAVGDALALTCAHELAGPDTTLAHVFGRNHPGGAIGSAYNSKSAAATAAAATSSKTLQQVMLPLADLTTLDGERVVGGDVLRAAYAGKTGWVRLGNNERLPLQVVSPARIRRMASAAEWAAPVGEMPWLVVAREAMLVLGSETPLDIAAESLRAQTAGPETVVAVVHEEGLEVVGVVEASAVMALVAGS